MALNARLNAAGKKPVDIVAAEENLEDEDILEMVNAGMIDATVVDSYVAEFWKQIFPNIQPTTRGRSAHQCANRLGHSQGQSRAQEGARCIRRQESHAAP